MAATSSSAVRGCLSRPETPMETPGRRRRAFYLQAAAGSPAGRCSELWMHIQGQMTGVSPMSASSRDRMRSRRGPSIRGGIPRTFRGGRKEAPPRLPRPCEWIRAGVHREGYLGQRFFRSPYLTPFRESSIVRSSSICKKRGTRGQNRKASWLEHIIKEPSGEGGKPRKAPGSQRCRC
jgi:hypothetical protein